MQTKKTSYFLNTFSNSNIEEQYNISLLLCKNWSMKFQTSTFNSDKIALEDHIVLWNNITFNFLLAARVSIKMARQKIHNIPTRKVEEFGVQHCIL